LSGHLKAAPNDDNAVFLVDDVDRRRLETVKNNVDAFATGRNSGGHSVVPAFPDLADLQYTGRECRRADAIDLSLLLACSRTRIGSLLLRSRARSEEKNKS
jgi:hypothetical protein